MSDIKISVILPVYNVEKYLAECLDSIINQTLKEIEIICVNDGSTDNSLAILKEYASKDKRIKIIDISNRGCGYARKIALKEVKGEYVLLCDSDDKYSSNESFVEMYEKIVTSRADLLLFDYYFITDKEEYIKYPVPEKEIFTYRDLPYFYPSMGIFLPIAPWMKLYKKSFLDKYQDWYLPEENVTSGDTPLHFQVVVRAKSISYLNKPLYVHYRRKNSLQTKKVTEKKLQEFCVHVQAISDLINKECDVELIKKNIIYYFFSTYTYRLNKYYLNEYYITEKTVEFIKNTYECINKTVNGIDLSDYLYDHDLPSKKKSFLFYKVSLRLSVEKLTKYFNKNYIKEKNKEIKRLKSECQIRDNLIKSQNETIVNRDNRIKFQNEVIEKRDASIKQKNNEIQNLHNQNNIQDQAIKRLQNSWSYRIGRLFTCPLSIPLDFYRFIRDYNLIKKSGLFDKEYYLSQNEDVKNAKMNPIKHYLQFGWKEGRNPSLEFDGNEYLNNRPDVRVASMCPLVHYIKFEKEEK